MELFNPEDFLVLIVDDISSNIHLITELLENLGYGTTFVTAGRDVMERVESHWCQLKGAGFQIC